MLYASAGFSKTQTLLSPQDMCVFVLVCGHMLTLYYAYKAILSMCRYLPGPQNGKPTFVIQGIDLGLKYELSLGLGVRYVPVMLGLG